MSMAVATSRDVWESMRLAVDDRRARDNRTRLLIRRSRIYTAAALVCLALGLILIGMPRIQQLIGDRATDAQARSVSQAASLFPEGSRQSAIRSAVEYNQRLYESGQPQIGEPVFDGKTKGDFEGDDEYRRQLSVNGLDAMGELLVPKISVDLPIMHGATLFTRLGELEKGDPFYIKVMGNTLAYRVNDIRIVSPTDTKALKIRKGRDEVTLLTCTGQGNTLRLLVTGERNSMPDQAPLPGASPGDTKQAALVSGVTVTGVLAVGFSLCRGRRVAGRHMAC